MDRRTFLAASAAAGVAPLGRAAAADAPDQQGAREIYEIRRYHTIAGAKAQAMNTFLSDVGLPALNRAGVSPVGAFSVVYGENAPSLVLLLTHRNMESVATLRDRLMADQEYVTRGASFLDAPSGDPAFVRMESTILRALTGMPKLEVPTAVAEKKTHILELRTYESPSDRLSLRKIAQMNAGEPPIFRRVGLTPVFFAETVAGARMPGLSYMCTFPDMRARDEAWAAFSADPDWKKLSSDPAYGGGTVTSISDIILRPTAYSQI
jgi:hypothetical protein